MISPLYSLVNRGALYLGVGSFAAGEVEDCLGAGKYKMESRELETEMASEVEVVPGLSAMVSEGPWRQGFF